MKEILILSIPLAGMLFITYLMLQHFHNKNSNDYALKNDLEKTKTFFPLKIQNEGICLSMYTDLSYLMRD